jgi:hypothetical protein
MRTQEAATTDAQRQAQAGVVRTNAAIEGVNKLAQVPFGDGQFLTVSDGTGGRKELIDFLAAGTFAIPHTLGRPVQGFIVVDVQQDGNHRARRNARTRSEDAVSIELNIQAICSLKIWVW